MMNYHFDAGNYSSAGKGASAPLPISAEVRGHYRIWRAEIQRVADRVEALFDNPFCGAASGNFTHCRGKGRLRALGHLRRFYEGAGARFVDFDGERVRWTYLRPADDEILTKLTTIDQRNYGTHPWVIVFTDHALQRALQRAARGLDLVELVSQALDGARRLSLRFLMAKSTPGRVRIGAGEGAFACEMWRTKMHGYDMPIIRAKTWLSADQMSAVQEAQIVADGDPGERLDDVYEQCRQQWCLPPLIKHRRTIPRR
jgi:hypothetical protein